jgi:hypothetical protein
MTAPGKTLLKPAEAIIGTWTIDVEKTENAPENASVADSDMSFKISLDMLTNAVLTFTRDKLTVEKQSDTDPLNETVRFTIISMTADSITIVNNESTDSEVQATIVFIDNNTIKWYEKSNTDMPVIIFRRI